MFDLFQDTDPALEPKRLGRPPLLDDRKRRVVITLLANGSSRRVAARYVGCSPSTIAKAIARDQVFAAAVAQAEQSIEVESLREIRRAAKERGNWRAAAWLLERHNPQDFAPRPHNSFSDEQVGDMLFVATANFVKSMTDEEFDQTLARLNTALRETRRSPNRLKQLVDEATPLPPMAGGLPDTEIFSTRHSEERAELQDDVIAEPAEEKELAMHHDDVTKSTEHLSDE